MADTRVQERAEKWIVENMLRERFGVAFSKQKVKLRWGGSFEFDAVSADGKIAACVSTSRPRTARGRPAVGKFHKIRADALHLLNACAVERHVLVFTDKGMVAHFENEARAGRFPPPNEIELLHAKLPDDMADELREAESKASEEVSPGRRGGP